MTVKRESKWVVIDAKAQVMRCDRCGHTEPLALINGRQLDFALGIMKAFVDIHKKCKARAA